MTSSSAARRTHRALLLAALVASLLLGGCATRRTLYPKLTFEALGADKQSPQTAGTPVRWSATVRGGIGERTFEFRIRTDGEVTLEASGPAAEWDWIPSDPGVYEVSVTVRDSLGYVVESAWSPPFAVARALELTSFSPSLASPRRAAATRILWKVDSAGGVGSRVHEFRLDDGVQERVVQTGPSDGWPWSPRARGTYRVQATVSDTVGNVVQSDWSEPFEIEPAVSRTTPIAIFPLENLSGHAVSLDEIEAELHDRIVAQGLRVVEQSEVEAFMARHRVRHVGGLPASLGRLFEQETGAAAVLVGSVEQHLGLDTPRFAMHARLVSTGDRATVLWMDGVALAGHQSPGWLELGLVRKLELLWKRAIGELVGSLDEQVEEEQRAVASRRKGPAAGRGAKRRRFRPLGFHRSADSILGQAEPLRVAVLPFVNECSRFAAGKLVTLHFLERMTGWPNVEVVEPGDVRQALLQSRLILEGGPSLPQSDLLRSLLNVDVVLHGSVTDYRDPRGELGDPVVAFSVQAIDARRRRASWTSSSRAGGGDGVFFFDTGRVHTAHELAERMVHEVVARMLRPRDSAGR